MTNLGFEAEMKDQFYAVAEQLFKEEKKTEAAPLYRIIIDRTDHNDQMFLLCQFRLFQCLVGISTEENKEALERFESFYSRLTEDTRLDALLLLANVCYSLGDWKRVERYGDELYACAIFVYDRLKKENFVKNLHTERHLVVYYGHGLRIKGFVLTMQGRYEEAKKYVAEYSDLGWFECLDDVGKKEVEKFRTWGMANMYNLELKTGNNKVLPELSKFLNQNREEILPSLLSVVESANQFRFDADDIINKFSIWLPPVNSEVTYINGTQLFHFWYEKAKYDFKKKRIVGGIDELLYALYLAHRMNYYTGFEKCVSLFRKHSEYATEQQKLGYKNIVEGVFDL
ncbi:tetratricopeptide repeat protein [Paenibacillus elgii]